MRDVFEMHIIGEDKLSVSYTVSPDGTVDLPYVKRLGVAYDKRRNNGTRKADDAFVHRVVQLLRRTPEDFGWRRPTWTRELLCLQMKKEGRSAVATCTMGRVLARLGARLGMLKPVVLCPWKRDAREAWL